MPIYSSFSIYHNDVITAYLIIILLGRNRIDRSTLEEYFLKDLLYIKALG